MTLIASFIAAALWAPLVAKFIKSWRERGNPISLAICFALLVLALMPVWLAVGPTDGWKWVGATAVSMLAVVYFYASVAWSAKMFKDSRRRRARRAKRKG